MRYVQFSGSDESSIQKAVSHFILLFKETQILSSYLYYSPDEDILREIFRCRILAHECVEDTSLDIEDILEVEKKVSFSNLIKDFIFMICVEKLKITP